MQPPPPARQFIKQSGRSAGPQNPDTAMPTLDCRSFAGAQGGASGAARGSARSDALEIAHGRPARGAFTCLRTASISARKRSGSRCPRLPCPHNVRNNARERSQL